MATTGKDKELNEAQKFLADGIRDQAEEQASLTKTLKDSNPKFRQMFKNLGEADAKLADSLAYSKQHAANSYAGVLQSRKNVRLTEGLTKHLSMSKDDLGKAGDEFAELENYLGKDLATYRDAQDAEIIAATEKADHLNSAMAEEKEIANNQKKAANRIKSRQKKIDEIDKLESDLASSKLDGSDRLSKAEEELNAVMAININDLAESRKDFHRMSMRQLQDEVQNALTEEDAIAERVNTEKAVHEKANSSNEKQLGYYERRLEQLDKEKVDQDDAHEKTIETFDAERKNVEEKMSAIEQDEGRFGQFSDGIKNLTGIDLAGYADDMVEGLNSVGKIFGVENLAESVFSGIGSMLAPLGTALATASAPFIAGFKKIILNMWKHVKKMLPVIISFIAASIAFVVSLWASISAMAAAALAIIAPVLPFILIGLAIVALAALLIWGGMWLYENSEVFRNAIDAVVGYFMDIVSIIGDIFGGFYDFFAGLFSGDFDRMFSGLEDIFGGLWDLFLAPFRAIGDFIKETFGIDIGQWLTDKLREWLPGWALNLLGMGGDEGTDALQAGLIDETDKATQKEDLASAKESGLYDENWRGDSTIDKEKMAEATDAQLQAIMRDNDISEEDRSMVLETLNQRQVDAGGQDVSKQIADAREEGLSGAALAEKTAELKLADETATEASVTATTVVTTNSPTNNNLNVAKNARETDPTLGRVSSSGYAFGPFGPEPA